MSLSGHQDSSREEHWWFGALCEQCGYFVPVGRDPTEGKTARGFRSAAASRAVLDVRRRAICLNHDLIQRRTNRYA